MSYAITSAAPVPERYVVLDGWRGICAILVALFHFPLEWHFRSAAFVRGSWLFVDFFFVLSGFVIAHAYAGKLSTRRDLVAFVIRRFGRLWPLHFTLLAILVGAAVLKYLARSMGADIEVTSNPANTLYSIITNILFLHSFGLNSNVTWNTPSWSISAEFLANLIFGVCFLLAPKGRILIALALSAIGAMVLLIFSPIDTSSQYGLFRCMYGFFLGYVVYRVTVAAPSLQRQPLASVAEGASIIAIAIFVTFEAYSPWRILAPFVFAVAIWVFAAEQGAFSKLLKHRALVIVGLLSYSIYMTHMVIIITANNAIQLAAKMMSKTNADSLQERFFANSWCMDAVVVIFVAVIIGVSWCTYNFIEVPWRRRLNRIANEISPKRELVPLGLSFGIL